ncbi:MAG: PIN domain-containing protein, partial [Halanaerobium sp.]
MSKKIFVIDTNVLLMNPRAIFSFEDNDVIIPMAVLEEIDDQKNESSDLGYNARETSRILEDLRELGRL